jgi:hypothetical protein
MRKTDGAEVEQNPLRKDSLDSSTSTGKTPGQVMRKTDGAEVEQNPLRKDSLDSSTSTGKTPGQVRKTDGAEVEQNPLRKDSLDSSTSTGKTPGQVRKTDGAEVEQTETSERELVSRSLSCLVLLTVGYQMLSLLVGAGAGAAGMLLLCVVTCVIARSVIHPSYRAAECKNTVHNFILFSIWQTSGYPDMNDIWL